MKDLVLSRVTLVWALLVGATMLSWGLGHGLGFDDGRPAGVGIIVVTFVKVRFVLFDFMEVRHAPRWMRRAGEAWIVLIAAALIGLFITGAH